MTAAISRSDAAIIEQAKSAPEKDAECTNCGKPEIRKKPAGQPKQRKLIRVPSRVSRLMEFCTKRELVNQTGHDSDYWHLVVLKEAIDNALDAAEDAEIAPVLSVTVVPGSITIEDNGPGIPAETIKSVIDYDVRVSTNEAYVSPTRGAQGNALKTILPMGYVMDAHRGEGAAGRTTIESHGIAHHIEFAVDHIRLEPKITRKTTPSPVVLGTRITVMMPLPTGNSWVHNHHRAGFLKLAESFAWINPHLSLKVSWCGKVKLDVKATDPSWRKWLPCWPTSAHWYDLGRFRRYMAAHISNNDEVTVRSFVSEFDGMARSAKQKEVLAATGASHVSLHDWFGRDKVNGDNVKNLLAAIRACTKPVRPATIGVIGKAHLFHMMERAGGEPKTFNYQPRLFETDGLPYVVEFAFGILRAGLDDQNTPNSDRIEITGVNWSPGIGNPFRQIGRSGEGLDAVLANARANSGEPVIAALHVACPRVKYTDRGKSAIVVDGESEGNGNGEG
jgi:DNA topoisomerase VI subunit B